MSVICLRIGAFREDPIVSDTPWELASRIWVSPEDLAQLVERCLEAEGLGFRIFYAVSENKHGIADITNARALVRYRPMSNLESFAKSYKVLGGPEGATKARALLVQAAILDHPEAIQSLQQWLEIVDLESEHPEPISYRLLPLVYHNLSSQQIEHPLMNRLKGVYRRSWLENQVALQQILPFLAQLNEQGIEVILLDDLASILRLYKGQGLRRPYSLDILVRPADVARTLEYLRGSNIWPKVSYGERFLETESPLAIWSPLDLDMTLQWRILPSIATHEEALETWRNAVPAVLGDCPVLTPDLESHFLRTCVRANTAKPEAAFFAMIDIAWMLRNDNRSLNWDRLIALTRHNRHVLLVQKTLQQIGRVADLPMLTELLRRLESERSSLMERLEVRAVYTYRPSVPMPARVLRRLLLYRRSIRIPGPIGPLRYLQFAWGGRRLLSLPRLLLRRAGMRRNPAGRPR